MKTEVTRNAVFLSKEGGTVRFVRDGEILTTVAVPAGRVRASQYYDLLPEGAHMEVADGVAAFQPAHRIAVLPYGEGSHETGANPDFQPTSSGRLEREMRVTLNRMKATTDRLERREKALRSIERIPKASEVEAEVVEAPAPSKPAAKKPEEAGVDE